MRNPVTAMREWWVNRSAQEPPEPRRVDPDRPSVQQLLKQSRPHRRRDEPLADICLHDFDAQTGQLGCWRGPTSNRLLCGKHAAQHDRVKRDRARKKRARAQRQKARR